MGKPDDIPQGAIEAMCLTWRHDFGLMAPPADADGRMAWSDGAPMGMTAAQKDGLRLQMRQLYQHHILPAILAEREACALEADAYSDQFPAYPEFDQLHNAGREVALMIRKRGEPK